MALVIVLALLLCTCAFSGIWFFLLRGESAGTDVLIKQLVANAEGEAVAAQISALVNRLPFSRRFYMRPLGVEDPPGSGHWRYIFTHHTYPFLDQESRRGGRLGRMSWSHDETPTFEGVVEDAYRPLAYRIKVHLTFSGTDVYMTWDKSWAQAFLGALNTDNCDVATRSGPANGDGVDLMIDQIRSEARKNTGYDEILGQIDQVIDHIKSGKDPKILLVP